MKDLDLKADVADRERTTYWVMYTETLRGGRPFYDGKTVHTQQHCGYGDRESAVADVHRFRELASRGSHFLNSHQWPNLVIGSAWLEVERRQVEDC